MTKTATRPLHVLTLDEDAQTTRRTLEKVGFKFVVGDAVARPANLDITEPHRPEPKEWDQVAHLENLFEMLHARTGGRGTS